MSDDDLSKSRTKLSNQRTYLAYMRTGFAISSIAGIFKQWWIMGFGVFMIITSLFQYYAINKEINKGVNPDNRIFNMLPIIYTILAIGTFLFQFTTRNKLSVVVKN